MFQGVPQEAINAQKYKVRGKIDRRTTKNMVGNRVYNGGEIEP
jgi:hypothetical protein